LATVDHPAIQLDGIDTYGQAENDATLNITGNLTVEAWIYPNPELPQTYTTTWRGIVSKGGTPAVYALAWGSGAGNPAGRELEGEINTSDNGRIQVSSNTLELGVWNHAALVYDGSNLYLYHNGAQVGSATATGSITTNTEYLWVGWADSDRFFPGKISEVRIWSVARTQTQIQDNIPRTLAGDESGLEAYWRLFSNGQTSTPDFTENNNDLALADIVWHAPSFRAALPSDDNSRDDLTGLGYADRQEMINAGYDYRIQPTPGTAQFVETYDAGFVIPSTRVRVTLAATAIVGTVNAEITISTKETLAEAWTDFPAGQSQVFATQFRYVKVQVDYTAQDDKSFIEARELRTVLSTKIKNDSGVVQVDANPTTVNFNVDFIDVQGLTLTPQGTQSRNAVYDFQDVPNPTSFDVYLFDDQGNPVTGEVRWTARGF
jgi:hypothetical protein